MGQIIVNGNPNKKNKILMTNRIVNDYLGYQNSYLEGKNINILMPSNIVAHHDFLMEQFLFSDKALD
jgi:PAS domain S-box-containing protein